MSNQLTEHQMIDALNELEQARIGWEQGTLKASNDELHALLNRCVLLYRALEPSLALKTKLKELLDGRGIKSNSNAGLPTRVVRWVFGDCGDQVFVYARAIKAAAAGMAEDQSMGDWLKERGGLSNAASQDNHGKDKKQRRIDQIALGRSVLESGVSLASVPTGLPGLQPSADSFDTFAIALVRRSAASHDIVFGVDNAALVNGVLLLAGKGKQSERAVEADLEAESGRAEAVEEAVTRISEELHQ